MENRIEFTTEDGVRVNFEVIEETMLNGKRYLLVTEGNEGEESEESSEDAYVLREMLVTDTDEITYEMVTEDVELNAVGAVFGELLEDTTII